MADYFEEFVTGRPGIVLARDEHGNPSAVGHDGTVEGIAVADRALRCSRCGCPWSLCLCGVASPRKLRNSEEDE